MAADTIRFIVTVAIVVYKGLIPVVGRMLTVVLQEGENPADAGQGHFRFPLPEGEEGQEEEAGEEDKDGRWETVYACGER